MATIMVHYGEKPKGQVVEVKEGKKPKKKKVKDVGDQD